MPSNSTGYDGQTVDFGACKLRVRGTRVEAELNGYRVTIAGGRLFVEHDGHRPWLSPNPDTIYVVDPNAKA